MSLSKTLQLLAPHAAKTPIMYAGALSNLLTPMVAVHAFSTQSHGMQSPPQLKFSYTPSVHAFIRHIQSEAIRSSIDRRYVQNTPWNVWVNKDAEIKSILDNHFSELQTSYALQAPVIPYTPTPRTLVRHTPDNMPDERSSFSISSGGISAIFNAYFNASIYKKHKSRLEGRFTPPVYIIPADLKRSASKGNSGQFHVSHALPMYTDTEFAALYLFWITFKRYLPDFLIDKNDPTINPEHDNFLIAEIRPSSLLKKKVLKVGLGYLFHELQYKLRSHLGLTTIADETIQLAIESGRIMDIVGKELDQDILVRNDTIRVAYTEAETKEMEALQHDLSKYNISMRELSQHEVAERSGTTPKIGQGGSIWEVKGDGNVAPEIFDILSDAIQKNGGKVMVGMVDSVFVNPDSQQVKGVAVNLGMDQNNIPKSQTLLTENLYTSFGSGATYQFDHNIEPKNSIETIISATGMSAYLLVVGKQPITVPVDSNNSHFTPLKNVKTGDEYTTLIKATCGGAIGSKTFCTDHAINALFYAAHVIFPDSKVHIISARSCSRPINTRNSGILTHVLPGWRVGTGFGGKGLTDAAAFAAHTTLDSIRTLHEPTVTQWFQNRYINPPKNDPESPSR